MKLNYSQVAKTVWNATSYSKEFVMGLFVLQWFFFIRTWDIAYFEQILIAFFACVMIGLIHKYEKGIIGLAVFIPVVGVAFFIADYYDLMITRRSKEAFLYLLQNDGYDPSQVGNYQLLWAVLASFVIYFVLFKISELVYVKVLFALIILMTPIYFTIQKLEFSKVSLILGLLYLCIMSLDLVERKNGKYLIAFGIMMVALSLLGPKSEDPIPWKKVSDLALDAAANIEDFVDIRKSKSGEFSLNQVGFSQEDKKLGGNVLGNKKRPLFKISIIRTGLTKSYLSGSVKDYYSGTGWETTPYTPDPEFHRVRLELLEKLYYLYQSRVPSSENELFGKDVSYKLKIDRYKTDTVFYPEQCYRIICGDNRYTFAQKDANLRFSRRLKKKDEYQISGVVINELNPNFVAYLSGEIGDTFKDSKGIENTLYLELFQQVQLTKRERLLIESGEIEDLLKTYRKDYVSNHLQIPDSVPQRVKDLAEQITKDAKSPYEKAKLIQNYLRANYEYTLKPGKNLEGDFVDNFLFQQKEGYCTYFTSAMCIMCRSVGIPTRYVEGLRISLKNPEKGWYSQYSNQAHAWTEIYLENYGWVRLDATPGFETMEYDWERREEIVASEIDYSEQYRNQYFSQSQNSLFHARSKGEKKGAIGIIVWMVVATLFLLVCVGIGFYYRSRKQFDKLSKEDKIMHYMSKILTILRKRKYGIHTYETLKEYCERLKEEKLFSDSLFYEKMEWFEEVRYGNRKVEEGDVAWFKQFVNQIKKRKQWVQDKREQINGETKTSKKSKTGAKAKPRAKAK